MITFGTVFLIISNSFISKKDKTLLYSRTTTILLFFLICLLYTGTFIDLVKDNIGLYGGLLVSTPVNFYFQIFLFVVAFIIATLTSFYSRKVIVKATSSLYSIVNYSLLYNPVINNKMSQNFKIMEYSLLFLFVIIGTLFLISSNDLVTIFISLELQSYGLYLISASHRDSESATGAALMYFLLGGLASCFILLGIALLYLNSGNTTLDNFYIINNIILYNYYYKSLLVSSSLFYWYNSFYLIIGFLLLTTGLLFKISAAPFHFWSPDVYDGVPTIVTTFIAIIPKIPILILLLDLVYYTSKTAFAFYWTKSILISSVLSLIIGAVLGLTQIKIKKLFAYSTISHLGFILLGLSINKLESIQSFLFYLIQYTLSNLNAFILLLSIGYSLYFYKYKNSIKDKEVTNELADQHYSPIQYIEQCKGYAFFNPLIALSLAITLFSFIGVPPLIGFFGKQMILLSALDNNSIFMCLIAIITSVIAAVYYLKVVKQLYFFKNEYKLGIENKQYTTYIIEKKMLTNNIDNSTASVINNSDKIKSIFYNEKNITLSSYYGIIISILTMIILFFIFVPSELIRLIILITLNLNE
jgi:NADH-ubiquinone oxidoreductase chain 2